MLIGLIVLVVILYFALKHIAANNKDEQSQHEAVRREASKRILDSERNILRGSVKPVSPAKPKTRKPAVKRKKNRGGQISNLDLEITYEDAKGDFTVRTISVISYSESSGKIMAWCHLRNDQRSFFTSRIIEAIDVSTGEDIEDIDNYLIEAVRR